MRKRIRIPAVLALTLSLAVPALAQSTHEHHDASADVAKTAPADAAKTAPTVDPNKADLLHQEYVAKTAELRGKLMAKEAELETQLATNPGDEAAVKKLVSEVSTVRGQLLEQTTLLRIRYAKETGMPMRMTRDLDHMGGQDGMKDGQAKDMCKDKSKGDMMGKGMMGGDMGKGMKMGTDMKAGTEMGKGMKMGADMKGAMPGTAMGQHGQGMDMPGPANSAATSAGPAKAADTAKTN